MPVRKVNVKWGKELFKDIELDTEEPPLVFKAQLYALSNVAPDNQKIMAKGKVLKDDDWSAFVPVTDAMTLMLMGSAEASIRQTKAVEAAATANGSAPADGIVDEQELDLPVGLDNLGNTCYANATMQCLRSVPELRDAVLDFNAAAAVTRTHAQQKVRMLGTISKLFRGLDGSKTSSFTPMEFVQILREVFPQFNTRGERGAYEQQDASECWRGIVDCLKEAPPKRIATASTPTTAPPAYDANSAAITSVVDQYFRLDLESKWRLATAADAETDKSKSASPETAAESAAVQGEEASELTRESDTQIACFIDKDVKYLITGLRNKLTETVTKHNPATGADADFIKSSRLTRLPAYLTVQLMRFEYKTDKNVNAKILKDVQFPLDQMDVYELCSDSLKKKLLPMRQLFKKCDDFLVQKPSEKGGKTAKPAPARMAQFEPFDFSEDPGSNSSGYYDLQAVVTHKGRTSNAGHYVGWVRRRDPAGRAGKDHWLMFDDDTVKPVVADEVAKLSGGGDWHCAYILLYGPRRLRKDVVKEVEEKEKEDAAAAVKDGEKPDEMQT